MKVPFVLVDVFTDRPLAGNQLCVVPEPIPLETAQMQAVAKEIGFSETTFVSEASGDRYAMRIFTPGGELPFAGHPSLGTAFVLVSRGAVTSPATQKVAAGEFWVSADPGAGTARMRQGPPVFGPVFEDRVAVARAAGLQVDDLHPSLPVQAVSTGLRHLMVPAVDRDAVVRANAHPPTVREVVKASGSDGFYLFAADTAGAKARLFDADLGVGEDPATGSAAGPLGAYLVHHGVLAPGEIVVSQGVEIGRPSTLVVDVADDGGSLTVHVGGGVAIVGEGRFDLPF
ncbi:MAG TPA: PhzF family phenazine biosynthesis protein [Actinomycetota bacterium]|nr:PhzF family phenazine biosynthesis protein [Actinomycetota bacterium]